MKLTINELALYLGCEAMVCYLSPVLNFKVKLVGFDHDGSILGIYEGTEPGIAKNQIIEIGEIKPILRQFDSLTDEEAIEIAYIIYGSPDSVKWRVERKFNRDNTKLLFCKVWRKHYGISFDIDMFGEIECYAENEDGDLKYATYNHQHKVTKYLLSSGFDLFEWIKKGLAVKKEKVVVV